MTSRGRRPWARVGLVAGAFALVVAIAGIPLYVLPATDEPGEVDVVYVIGPPTDARMEIATAMMRDGDADHLMVSLDPEVAEEYPLAAAVCAGQWGESGDADALLPTDAWVLCDKPDPFTTRGEARWLDSMRAAHGWDSTAVITITPHISRARMIFERCDVGEVAILDSGESLDPWYWAYHYAYQTGAYVKAGVLQGC